MTRQASKPRRPTPWLLLLPLLALSSQQAQQNKPTISPLRIPHTTTPIPIDCTDTTALWNKIPRVHLAKQAIVHLPPAPELPPAIDHQLDALNQTYAFQWDQKNLYGYVDIDDPTPDTGHPPVTPKAFNLSPSRAASSDLFFSTLIVDIGAPSWQRWITEMHVHVRPPNAAPMPAMFFGRTNAQEDFTELPGAAVACPTPSGWIAKFSIPWLPFADWQPRPGAPANARLLVPLPHAKEGYILGAIIPFVLAR
jgi:hypothetical protein